MKRRWVAAGLIAGLVGAGSVVWGQSGRTSSMDGPQPRVAPGTRMGPEMRQGAYDPEAAIGHLGDMMRHLAGMLSRLGEAAIYGKLPVGPGGGESSQLLNQIAAMTQQIAKIVEEGRLPRKTMIEMGDQMGAMQEAMKRIPELAQIPPR